MRKGTKHYTKRGASIADRIRAMSVVDESGCWLWKASVFTSSGYARLQVRGKGFTAHRIAYEHFIGPVPEGFVLDHLCRVRHCVNPHHLEPVTQRENLLRGIGPTSINAGKTFCHRGHEFSESNLVRDSAGYRQCRICRNAYASKYSKAKRRDPETRGRYIAYDRKYWPAKSEKRRQQQMQNALKDRRG